MRCMHRDIRRSLLFRGIPYSEPIRSKHTDQNTGDDNRSLENNLTTAYDGLPQATFLRILLFLRSLRQQDDDCHTNLIIQEVYGIGARDEGHDRAADIPSFLRRMLKSCVPRFLMRGLEAIVMMPVRKMVQSPPSFSGE